MRPARCPDFRIYGPCPVIVDAEATGGIHSRLQHGTVPDFEIDAAASILGCRLNHKSRITKAENSDLDVLQACGLQI
jgi:hypothetical protein